MVNICETRSGQALHCIIVYQFCTSFTYIESFKNFQTDFSHIGKIMCINPERCRRLISA